MKERYIALMEKALSAYTDEHIERYFNEVKTNGLCEHGFPRLTANIGILIAHGRRRDLLPIFLEMMEFCCHTIPHVKAANDFSVREIVHCLQAVEEKGLATAEKIDEWKAALASIDPYSCYTQIAREPTDKLFNWALFTAVSEYRRNVAGLADTADIIDIQIATQLQWLDENGMYRDNLDHPPMVYDLVPRGLFVILLRLGYRGKYRERLEQLVRDTALLTLKMQSVTGEIAFGGRSNQFLHNEAWLALIFEYEAARYQREGNSALAATFKAAVCRALDNIEGRLSKEPIYHIKNRFPTETKYGCEKYAYFDKYMITVASFLYEAYLTCDDTVRIGEFDASPMTFQTSEYFHKVFLRAGGYALEFDTAADPAYDASGLGRIHRTGAPSTVCLSLPCPPTPSSKLTFDLTDTPALSLCPAIFKNGEWISGATSEAVYEILALSHTEDTARAVLRCTLKSGEAFRLDHTVSENGVEITVCGNGDFAYFLPAFLFDGENRSEIRLDGNRLTVKSPAFDGWQCCYTASGEITDAGFTACNRNGHYRAFAAKGTDELHITAEIVRDPNASADR